MLSDNKHISLAEFEDRKKNLEREIAELEASFDRRTSKVSKIISGIIAPSSYIRKHPFKSVGAAVTFGFLIGISGSKKNRHRKESVPVSGTPGISTTIFNELKRMATRKVIEYTSDIIDEKIRTRKKENHFSDF